MGLKAIKVDETTRRNLCAELEYRDRTALRLGSTIIEALRATDVPSDDADEASEREAGAALLEMFRMGRLALRNIEESEAKQTDEATRAIKALGIDIDSATYTIDTRTGHVLRLVRGAWQPVAEDHQ